MQQPAPTSPEAKPRFRSSPKARPTVSAPNVAPVATSQPATSGWQPFRPRIYPALMILVKLFYFAAGINAMWALLAVALVMFPRDLESMLMPDLQIFRMLLAVSIVCISLPPILFWVACGEVIKLAIDVQANTQETAHWSRVKT